MRRASGLVSPPSPHAAERHGFSAERHAEARIDHLKGQTPQVQPRHHADPKGWLNLIDVIATIAALATAEW
jgi:hypothetical protein